MKRLYPIVLFAWLTCDPAHSHADDWLQFQCNAANHGRASEAVEPPYQLRWVWYGEDNVAVVGRPCLPGQFPQPRKENTGLLSFTMHAVVADGRVIFGDLRGTLFCLNSRDGSTLWKRQFPGAFVHAVAVQRAEDGGRRGRNQSGATAPVESQRETAANSGIAHGGHSHVIVAPCQDGRIYGLNWDGQTRWTVTAERPFVTPAKLAGGVAFVGSLDGQMYAVEVATGHVLWRYDAGAAIRQPAAIAGGRVFFGSENMLFHAVDAATGRRLWQTAPGQFTGQSFRNTWPVIVGDRVMTFQVLVDGQAEFVMEALLFNATPGNHSQKRLEDWPKERDAILQWLAGDQTWAVDCQKSWQPNPGQVHPDSRHAAWTGGPLRKSFYVFDVQGDNHGRAVEPFQVPMGIVGGTGNANMGPVLDALGRPLTWWRVSARSLITGGSFGTAFSPDLSGLDLKTGDRLILPTARDIHRGGPGMELDNHHMLTSAGDYVYYHNPFRQARWIKLDGRQNPHGTISAVYGQHDGGGWSGDVVYYATKEAAGVRAAHLFDSHGAARTPIVIADGALFVNELDIRAVACYETCGRERPDNTATGKETVGRAFLPVPDEATGRNARPTDAAPTTTSNRAVSEYVWQRRVTVPPSDEATRRLGRWLAESIAGMLDAGHLLPYYCKRGELHPRWYFTNPGDTAAALARAYPHLPPDLQMRTAAYLRRELADYPPCSERLNSPRDRGVSRMDFGVPEQKWEWREDVYRRPPRVHNVYTLWLYADATRDGQYVKDHWPDVRSFYARHQQDTTAYLGGASAPLGLARLARLVGDSEAERQGERDAATAFQRLESLAAMQRPMAARYGFADSWPGPFLYCGFHLLHLTPEVARYVREHPAICRAVTGPTAAAVEQWPMWFASQASAFSRYYGESHALSPLYSAMIFPVKALVERTDPAQLHVWVDAEDAPRGDLFFLERLVLAIEAGGEERWVEVR